MKNVLRFLIKDPRSWLYCFSWWRVVAASVGYFLVATQVLKEKPELGPLLRWLGWLSEHHGDGGGGGGDGGRDSKHIGGQWGGLCILASTEPLLAGGAAKAEAAIKLRRFFGQNWHILNDKCQLPWSIVIFLQKLNISALFEIICFSPGKRLGYYIYNKTLSNLYVQMISNGVRRTYL